MALDLEQWEAIGRALCTAGVAAQLEESVPGWRFRLDPALSAWGRLLLDDGWAGFEAPLPSACRAASDWELLELNAVLPGACKIGLRPPDQRRLLLDIPLDNGAAAAERCRIGMVDLVGSWGWLSRAESVARAAADVAVTVSATAPATAVVARSEAVLVDWIRASGWLCEERDGGRVAVQLEGRGHPQQIWVAREETGLLRLTVPIARRRELAEESLAALGRYLLRVTGQRRQVCAAADARAASSAEIRFEVRLAEPLDAGLMDDGLGALALVVHTAGREARAMAVGDLAGHYAGMWCPYSGQQS
jgi:hypothetical protein